MMGDTAGGDDVVINVTRDLREKLSSNLAMSPLCSIFKVPTILSRHSIEAKAYLPDAFSFGPFHHNEEKLKPTEKIKHKYLLDLLSRLISNPNYTQNPKDRDKMLHTLTKAIHNVWKQAREYYAGPIEMETEKFVEVLVLDGCFIIEFFRKKEYKDLREENDPMFSMSCMLQFLSHDLILIENQLPWMVLDTLFSLTTTSIDKKPLVKLAIDFFSHVFSTKPPPEDCLLSHAQNKHILDLLRNSLVLTSRKKEENTSFDGKLEHMRSATSLDNLGIKFRKNDTSQSILDIKFDAKKGKLKIPSLLIQQTTEAVFRNLISLEQCCPHYEPRVTSYAVLLDNLINTKEDIELLCKHEAITTWLNVEEATKSFNNLYVDTYLKESFYRELTRDVDKYCQNSWHSHLKALRRDHFKNPWTFISVLAASILLILTFLQTVFSIKN